MSNVTISNTYLSGGYVVAPDVATVDVSATGVVGGTGLVASTSVFVENNGVIKGQGVYLKAGGALMNEPGAHVYGLHGVTLGGSTDTLWNYGAIGGGQRGVMLTGTASLQNGSNENFQALISGATGAYLNNGSLFNYGTIIGQDILQSGVVLGSGAGGSLLDNGTKYDLVALIEGGAGVEAFGAGATTLNNFGSIIGTNAYGVSLGAGLITNGGKTARAALIEGATAGVGVQGVGTVVNFGTVLGRNGAGVGLTLGGQLTNGSNGDTGAVVDGVTGVYAEAEAGIANFGTIHGEGGAGIDMIGGGTVANGSVMDTTALIEGYGGITITVAAGTVTNEGTILATAGDPGIGLGAGGLATNGSAADPTARIAGVTGVELDAVGTVVNFATIDGKTGYGALLRGGGAVTNGSATDQTALIQGYVGIGLAAGGSVANWATIRAVGVGYGISALSGGTIRNGAATVTGALIEGYSGLDLAESGTATNFGTLLGEGVTGAGAVLTAGATLINGSATSRGARIDGTTGILAQQAATVINFGTITGLGGTSVLFQASTDLLIDEAGSVLDGGVAGGGGTLELAAGTGTLRGLGGSVGGFNHVTIASGGHWTLDGSSVIAATATLSNDGGLTIAGVLINRGTVIGGTTGLVATGPATVTNFGMIDGAGGVAVKFDAASDRLVVEAQAGFVGRAIGDGGTLELAKGTGTLSGLGTSFSGFGTILVDAGANWTLAGASSLVAGETLTDHGKVTLAGTLSNQAGVLDFATNTGLSGSGALTNGGLVEKTGGGGAGIIAVTVANAGTIAVASGTLDLARAITGTGTLELKGSATLASSAAVASGQTVRFTGAGETLELTDPGGFKAVISGFGAGDTLDLRSIKPVAGESVAFTVNGGDTGGALKITDGAKSVSVALFGQYAAAGFSVGSDENGGSAVTYVPPPAPHGALLAAGS